MLEKEAFKFGDEYVGSPDGYIPKDMISSFDKNEKNNIIAD